MFYIRLPSLHKITEENEDSSPPHLISHIECPSVKQLEESRYYFSLILRLLCYESIDFLESINFQFFLMNSIKTDFFKLKNSIIDLGLRKFNNWHHFLENLNNIVSKEFFNSDKKENQKDEENLENMGINRIKELKLNKLMNKAEEEILRSVYFQIADLEKLN